VGLYVPLLEFTLNDLNAAARALLYLPLFAAFESAGGSAVKLYNQRRRAGRRVVWRPAGTVDLKRSQARSYFAPLSRSAITRSPLGW
jgi:hypothetical protein